MRHQQHRAARSCKFPQGCQHDGRILFVEVSRRFIGEQQTRLIEQRRARASLPLPAAQFDGTCCARDPRPKRSINDQARSSLPFFCAASAGARTLSSTLRYGTRWNC